MRHNTITVLQQISLVGIRQFDSHALSLKSVRESLTRKTNVNSRSTTAVPPSSVAEVGSSNLFYYLFEDTAAIAPTLAKSRAIIQTLVSAET
jgi:hypothetical protein